MIADRQTRFSGSFSSTARLFQEWAAVITATVAAAAIASVATGAVAGRCIIE